MNNMSHTTNSFIFVCFFSFFIPPLCMGRLILAHILFECCLCHHFCSLWFVFVWFLLTLAFCLDVDVRNVGFQLFVHLFVNSVVVVVLKMEIEEELMMP